MPTAPRFQKGQIVTPTTTAISHREYGVRKNTPSEIEAWYKAQRAISPFDSAGEPWIHDGYTEVPLTADMRLQVLQGACTSDHGFTKHSGWCMVYDLTTSTLFKANRKHLA